MIVKPSTIGKFVRGASSQLRMNQINLGRRELGVDEEWHNIGNVGEPSFSSGWQAYFAGEIPGFYKDTEGKVHLRGLIEISGAGQPSGINVFQLPSGYRPEFIVDPQVMFKGRVHGTAVAHFIWMQTFEIAPDGWCTIANGFDYTYVSLDDIVFWTVDD